METWDGGGGSGFGGHGPIGVPPRDMWELEIPDVPPLDELQERQWSRSETAQVRLVRLMFGVEGILDDEEAAPRSGQAYSANEQRLMRSMYKQGRTLGEIAGAMGRTPLGVGWKMLSQNIPEIPPAVAAEYLADPSP